tara:strand:+ start:639 stop:1625 length:987 start_codon:yes stop_codon:yes gene_type:complete
MGRPIRDQWTNEIRATHVGLEGLPPGNEIITGLCKIGANDVAKYTIVQQKGTNKFRVQDANQNEGTCTLVNKPADLSAGTTDPVLLADEMVMNCLDSGGVKHRVMKLMNRTLIYETDANVSKRAMWDWDVAAAAAGTDIETVQLQEIETVFAPGFVQYNGVEEFGEETNGTDMWLYAGNTWSWNDGGNTTMWFGKQYELQNGSWRHPNDSDAGAFADLVALYSSNYQYNAKFTLKIMRSAANTGPTTDFDVNCKLTYAPWNSGNPSVLKFDTSNYAASGGLFPGEAELMWNWDNSQNNPWPGSNVWKFKIYAEDKWPDNGLFDFQGGP